MTLELVDIVSLLCRHRFYYFTGRIKTCQKCGRTELSMPKKKLKKMAKKNKRKLCSHSFKKESGFFMTTWTCRKCGYFKTDYAPCLDDY